MAVNQAMKLQRLTSTTATLSHDAAERARSAAGANERRVEAAEGTAADRERSLHQELDAAAEKTPTVAATPEALDDARSMAEQIVHLGSDAAHLLKRGALSPNPLSVDTEA